MIDVLEGRLAALPDLDEDQRRAVRNRLRETVRLMRHGIEMASDSLDGPDPEAALFYLAAAVETAAEAFPRVLAELAN